MNDLIKTLLEQLRGTSGGTKLIAMMGAASFLVIIGLAAVVSRKSDFSATPFMDLSASEVSKIAVALNDEGIDFDVSSTAPYFIKVDESDKARSKAVAFAANALASAPSGIRTESGIDSVFSSAGQREQVVDKLKEEEIELMLITLDFVNEAAVKIAPAKQTAIGNRNNKPMSVAVIVTVAGPPSAQQKRSLASLVTNATGVDDQFVSITDHNGERLFDGTTEMDGEMANTYQKNYSFDWDLRTSSEANAYLAQNYGPNMISVAVKSEWDFEQRVERMESAESFLTSRSTSSTSKTSSKLTGGSPSLSADSAPSSGPEPETTKQEDVINRPMVTRTDKVINQPTLKHLSVTLTLDSSLEGIKDDVSAAVMGLVGYNELDRGDSFSTVVRDIYTEPVDENAEAEAAQTTSAPNPMLETLMRRGVEVLTASIFILVLMKSLKSASKNAKGAQGAESDSDNEMDLELLARANVDELLKSDPERVGEVLTAWARGEQTVGSK